MAKVPRSFVTPYHGPGNASMIMPGTLGSPKLMEQFWLLSTNTVPVTTPQSVPRSGTVKVVMGAHPRCSSSTREKNSGWKYTSCSPGSKPVR
jgi:hypothetical protein